MVDDAEARDAVRQLMKRLEVIAAQGGAMTYVLAKKDRQEYARLLKTAEVALKTVIQPISNADGDIRAVYAALDDPREDWSKAVVAMLNRGGINLTGEQAVERLNLLRNFEERFDAEMRDRNKNDEDEEPGIGKKG